MTYELAYGTVVDRIHKAVRVIHVVRVLEGELDVAEIDDIAERMRRRVLSKLGTQAADVVVVQGTSRESLRLFGEPSSVSRVRAALFNAAVSWSSLALD
ncbi:MAG TPA: hypothetical protein VHA77_03680 [Xanthobacteraceae bacterium]|jgi:hypothetical protein|nr:hypothetical protein [Xanthobacteraceae bacterium]